MHVNNRGFFTGPHSAAGNMSDCRSRGCKSERPKYPASIKCLAAISPPTKLLSNGVLLVGQCWPTSRCLLGKDIDLGSNQNLGINPH